jgi:hypothetical protein
VSDQVIGVIVVIVKSRDGAFFEGYRQAFWPRYLYISPGGRFFYCGKRIQKKIIIIKAPKNKISVFFKLL